MIMTQINRYIRWLRSLVDRPGSYYDVLFEAAWETAYEYSVPHDDNRAADGLRLRETFGDANSPLPDLGECRMLEFLVALSIRLNDTLYDWDKPDQSSDWFWKLIWNLELEQFDDTYSNNPYENIVNAFERMNLRLYNADGTCGGLFPLRRPKEDQREIEVWYQMAAYILENLLHLS